MIRVLSRPAGVAVFCIGSCLAGTACKRESLPLEHPVGETHKSASSTGGARPRGQDEPSGPFFVVIGDEVRSACKLPEPPPAPARFDFEAARLHPIGDDPLADVAACLASGRIAEAELWLIGHADPRGNADYNYRLGLYRATGAKQHLVGLGVADARMSVESRGARDATGTDEATWALDRRIEVHLTSGVRRPLGQRGMR